MKPKLKKPKNFQPFGIDVRPAVFLDSPRIELTRESLGTKEAIALRKWLGSAVAYLKQEARKK